VQHQLLRCQAYKRARALITVRSGGEYDRCESGIGTRVGDCSPRYEILHIFASSRGENREEQGSRRLSPVTGRGDDAQRASADPAAAPFVSKRRTPAATAQDCSRRTASVRDRAGPDNEENSRTVLEGVIQRDHAVGVDDYFFGDLSLVESRLECTPLFFASGSSDAAVQNSYQHRARQRNFSEAPTHEICNDFGGVSGLARYDGGLRSVNRRKHFAFRRSDENACLRSAAIDTDDNVAQFQRSPSVGAG
jgi:hypothetical protein